MLGSNLEYINTDANLVIYFKWNDKFVEISVNGVIISFLIRICIAMRFLFLFLFGFVESRENIYYFQECVRTVTFSVIIWQVRV